MITRSAVAAVSLIQPLGQLRSTRSARRGGPWLPRSWALGATAPKATSRVSATAVQRREKNLLPVAMPRPSAEPMPSRLRTRTRAAKVLAGHRLARAAGSETPPAAASCIRRQPKYRGGCRWRRHRNFVSPRAASQQTRRAQFRLVREEVATELSTGSRVASHIRRSMLLANTRGKPGTLNNLRAWPRRSRRGGSGIAAMHCQAPGITPRAVPVEGCCTVAITTRPNVIWRVWALACAAVLLAGGLGFAQPSPSHRKLDRAVNAARQASRPVGVILRAAPGREKEVRAALKARKVKVADEMSLVAGIGAVVARRHRLRGRPRGGRRHLG